MIEGVKLKKLKVIPDERGRLMKIVLYDSRKDSPTYSIEER